MADKQKRPMNIELLKDLARQFMPEYRETGLISIDVRGGMPSVYVDPGALSEVASPGAWTWATRREKSANPWGASVIIDGVLFYALFTDDERAAAMADANPPKEVK